MLFSRKMNTDIQGNSKLPVSVAHAQRSLFILGEIWLQKSQPIQATWLLALHHWLRRSSGRRSLSELRKEASLGSSNGHLKILLN